MTTARQIAELKYDTAIPADALEATDDAPLPVRQITVERAREELDFTVWQIAKLRRMQREGRHVEDQLASVEAAVPGLRRQLSDALDAQARRALGPVGELVG